MNLTEQMMTGSKEIGITLTEDMVSQFMKYKEILIKWNEKMNLTTITDDFDVLTKHFLDSLTIGNYVKETDRVIDVGTGAGFPGIPLKILYPKLDITLLDSLNKRITFLKEVADYIKVDNVNFVHGRAEECGNQKIHREQYDVVTSRAVSNLAALCEYTLPFVKLGGTLIAMKGPDVEEELQQSARAITLMGGQTTLLKKIQIPFTDITHSIIIVSKITKTPTCYPRKGKNITKNPLI